MVRLSRRRTLGRRWLSWSPLHQNSAGADARKCSRVGLDVDVYVELVARKLVYVCSFVYFYVYLMRMPNGYQSMSYLGLTLSKRTPRSLTL